LSRLAVITGANRGLGYATVRELAENGWTVVALTRAPGAPEDGTWPDGAVPVLHDARSDPPPQLTEALEGRPIDLLVNNAAQGARHAALGSIEAAGILNAVDVNVAWPLRLTQFLLPNLRRGSCGSLLIQTAEPRRGSARWAKRTLTGRSFTKQ
jgi:NAD(P)-dependent dehydrogenase (short-subunit alcohol dehydrogenase family)